MGRRRQLDEAREAFRDLADRHVDLVATTVARLADLQTSLEGLHQGLPRVRSRATDAHLLETRRRLDDIVQSLRQELDAGAPDPWYLAHRSQGVGHVLRSFAGQVVITLALAEVAEAHDPADLYRPVVSAWEQVESAAQSMDLVGDQVLNVAAEVREQESNPQPAVALTDEIEQPLDRALGALRDMTRMMTGAESALIPSLREKHVAARQALQLIYQDLKRGVDEARAVGEAPELGVLGASLRALRHAPPVSTGRRDDPGLKDVALTSLTRAMRAIQEAQAIAD